MFEDLFERPHAIEKYRSAPLYEDRLRYLVHVADGGAAPRTLYKIAYCQLNLVRLLDLREGETVALSQLTAVAEARFDREEHPGGQRAHSRASRDFLGHALRWLRSLGRVEQPTKLRHPYAAEIEAFTVWMRDERGLSEGTIHGRRQAVADFLNRLAVRNVPLTAVEMADVDEFLAAKTASGSCKRATINIVDARPKWPERSLFLTLLAPTRPLRTGALSEIVRRRLNRLGVEARSSGAHVLRHAAAQHLLDHGLPMKTVGDYLGHRRIASTSVVSCIFPFRFGYTTDQGRLGALFFGCLSGEPSCLPAGEQTTDRQASSAGSRGLSRRLTTATGTGELRLDGYAPVSGASNTAATSAANPSSSGDAALLPRAWTPCST